MKIWKAIDYWAKRTPDRASVRLLDGKSSGGSLSYSDLKTATLFCMEKLPDVFYKRVGLFIRNRPLWVIYDMALTLKGAVVVPLPEFFSKEQLRYIIEDAEIGLVIAESSGFSESMNIVEWAEDMDLLSADTSLENPQRHKYACKEDAAIKKDILPERIVKIIYTSGTTGTPKGVMIRLGAIEAVATSLIKRTGASRADEHLSLLPLSMLLETIGGLYAPLMAGAGITYPPLKKREDTERIDFDPDALLDILSEVRPSTLILVPYLLESILSGKGANRLPSSLRFVACGGGHLSSSILKKVEELGLPVFEGYGLSECTSVVAVNGRGCSRPGSVGKPLDHVRVKVKKDGEIMVSGASVMAGYLKEGERDITLWHTGDIGHIDRDGYLYVTGRKDALFSTALGRSISPEWLENKLSSCLSVRQIMVLGERRPYVSALIVPDSDWFLRQKSRLSLDGETKGLLDHPEILKAIFADIKDKVEELPEYARVKAIALIDRPFTVGNGLMALNGRLRRDKIIKTYRSTLDKLRRKRDVKTRELFCYRDYS